MGFNWQHPDWPEFRYDLSRLEERLLLLATRQGEIGGMLNALPGDLETESVLDIMVVEALKTSAIEGEMLSREEIRSSLRNQLGLNRFPERIKDRRAEGVARLMVAVREGFEEALTENTLFEWHRMLMEPYANIRTGQWRSGPEPMQIVSGPAGKEVIHFEAPNAERLPAEMRQFIRWFNATAPGQAASIPYAPVRSAIAHLYFESIHPFEDGNGRIGRVLSEKALSQGAGIPVLINLSQAIESDRQAYYAALKASQHTLEITPWLEYFTATLLEAQERVLQHIRHTIAKVRFFDRFAGRMNPRQAKVLNRMFDAGPGGFEGGMQARKYMSIARTSKATATRDLQELVQMGALTVQGGGRGTRYDLKV
jgi:Fic family protein